MTAASGCNNRRQLGVAGGGGGGGSKVNGEKENPGGPFPSPPSLKMLRIICGDNRKLI